MRPRELTLRGFRSYREEVTFDLRGRHLIGIVGPIGSGKSTILDGITFALFGKTPRVQRDTKTLIHQLADAAHVRLVFEVDGSIWQVTRALKRKGQGQVQLVRLSEDAADAPPIETVVLERPVRDRIDQLLGMDFDTFGRSVLLAQNRFAEFLLAADGPRNAVLKGVFGYERFDAASASTRERVAREEATVAALDVDGARLLQARDALETARSAAERAATQRDRLLALRPDVDALDRRRDEARERAMRAEAERARLARAGAAIPDPMTLEDTVEQITTADADAATAVAAADAASGAREEAEAARDAAAEHLGDLRAFAELVAQLRAHADAVTGSATALERATAAVVAAEDLMVRASAARDEADTTALDAEATVAEATDGLAAADEALHAARHGEMASELRHGLISGEPCPVCAQVVTTRPRAAKSAGVRGAERARAAAASRQDKAMRARDRANTRVASAAAAAEGAAADRDRLAAAAGEAEATARAAETALATTQSALVDRLGEGDPAVLLEERQQTLTDADAAARRAIEDERRVRDRLDHTRGVAAEAAARLAAIREQLAAAWGALDLEPEMDPGVAAIRDASDRLLGVIGERADAADEDQRASTAELSEVERARAELLTSAGLTPEADVAQVSTEAQVEAAHHDERVRGLEEILAQGADLDERMSSARERLAVARRLRDDLQPSRFLAWLLDEERALLAELASVHLAELTDGDYRFSDDGAFRIVDVNAGGAVRAPESLSGGETFLASLALALALAEMVTRGGGRLDSFFLDEGFGSLDPEHIERAMRGIEHLVRDGGGDRLVVLVSHVEQMHELLEDLIVLEKDEAAGTSRVLTGATPA
jgi:exonuclease SbcC